MDPPAAARTKTASFTLNTGRYRDQWHTMTRMGLSTRLSAHRPEPLLEIAPEDAQAHGLHDGGLARVATEAGRSVYRVASSEGQRPGEIFVPMHWTEANSGAGRTFVTAHTRKGKLLALDWQALADPQATLAVYMGKRSAPEIAKGLMQAGLPGSTPVALVENASLASQRHFFSRLDLLPIAARSALGGGPAILLIGEAVNPDREERAPQAVSHVAGRHSAES